MDMLQKGGNKFQQKKAASRWNKYEVRKEYRDRVEELIFLLAITRKEGNLNKRIPLSGKCHVISPVSTSFCSGYPFLYNNTIKICVFSKSKYPSFLPPKQ